MNRNKTDQSDIKKYSYAQLTLLAERLRRDILSSVSKNGGHLASNLGMVEATVAIHRVFDLPNDTLIFDVGHQCYAHKLLTGRSEQFKKLRTLSGASGFTNPAESEYDKTYAGHAGSSLSTALGIARSKALRGDESYVVAVVGDGAFTNGMIYEALNNCAVAGLRLIIILNDNKMSISPNVGGLSRFFEKTRTSEQYFTVKHYAERALSSLPRIGGKAVKTIRGTKNALRRLVVSDNLFECLGIEYLGPVDGHNIRKLELVLREAKSHKSCCVVHIRTKKGKGYGLAEAHPEKYHGVGPFDIDKGVAASTRSSYSDVFGRLMCRQAETDGQLCAVTAAMCDGTGLGEFAKKYPRQFFDVGIAEEHAAAFCGGLALDGRYPVFAVYSTFAQRVFDQLFHDVYLQEAPMMLALDRGGLVPSDGVTHQGIFDVGLLSGLPNAVIYSPDSYAELEKVFVRAVERRELCMLRYPRDCQREYDRSGFTELSDGDVKYCDLHKKSAQSDVVVITYGRVSELAYKAASQLNNVGVRIIKLVKIFPLDVKFLSALIGSPKLLYILEEGAKSGGVGEKLCAALALENAVPEKTLIRAAENAFLPQATVNELFELCGFLPEQVRAEIEKAL